MPKILIVDDEYIERKGMIMLFQKVFQGYGADYDPIVILEAENGRDALTMIVKDKPDILMTDIKMPIMDGISLITNAVSIMPELVTIIISAYGEFEYARAAIEYGVSNYILKPVVPDEFARVMKKVLDKVTKKNKAAYENEEEQKTKDELTSSNMDMRENSANRVVREVLMILQNEYMMDLSMDEIASRVFLSTSYLSYIFKKYTGKTVMKYLMDMRLDKAKEILQSKNMKIADVAVTVGYRDISYFCTQFKNKFGMTPTKLKNNVGNE